MTKKAFTLLELIAVIVLLAILATLGFTQYEKTVERGRSAEAKVILGELRSAEIAYRQQFGGYTATVSRLAVGIPTACATTHFFRYGASTSWGYAYRCTGGTGKTPSASTEYTVALSHTGGVFSGTQGYY